MTDWSRIAINIRSHRVWICFYEPDTPMIETEIDNDGNRRNVVEGCGGPKDGDCLWLAIWGDEGKAEELCCTHHKTDVGCGWYRLEKG